MEKMKVVSLPKKKPRVNLNAVQVLEEALEKAKNGEISRVGMVYKYRDDRNWGSTFSSSENCVEDFGMLMELAIRRMGFIRKD